jgi:hypothetical protein
MSLSITRSQKCFRPQFPQPPQTWVCSDHPSHSQNVGMLRPPFTFSLEPWPSDVRRKSVFSSHQNANYAYKQYKLEKWQIWRAILSSAWSNITTNAIRLVSRLISIWHPRANHNYIRSFRNLTSLYETAATKCTWIFIINQPIWSEIANH